MVVQSLKLLVLCYATPVCHFKAKRKRKISSMLQNISGIGSLYTQLKSCREVNYKQEVCRDISYNNTEL